MPDQKQHWNILHQKEKAKLETHTDFAQEVQKLMHAHTKILELGCGTGIDSYFFAQQGNQVVATDFSDVVIARNKNLYSNPRLAFQIMDMSKPLPFTNDTFDCVYSRLSMHYFTDSITKNIFREIHRVLKPSGYLCFVCKSIEDPLFGKGKKLEEDIFENDGHVRHFFRQEYVKECLKDMFAIQKMESGNEDFYGDPSAFIKVIARKK